MVFSFDKIEANKGAAMILGEKIMSLRKRMGWSQEELAQKLGVSRQSVSKWESSTSIPDIQKIMALATLFGVSTDYLLRDELEEPVVSVLSKGIEYDGISAQADVPSTRAVVDALDTASDTKPARFVTLDEAQAFLETVKQASGLMALGVFLCVASPVVLLILTALSQFNYVEDIHATTLGLTVLLCMVAAAVGLCITQNAKLSRFEYLSKEVLSLQYGVEAVVRRKQEATHTIHHMCITIGVVLCIVSAIPLFWHVYLVDYLGVDFSVSVMLLLIASAVFLFVKSTMVADSFSKLLQEEEYNPHEKLAKARISWLAPVYWLSVVAVYLIASFSTDAWNRTWAIWAVAGVLYPLIHIVVKKFTASTT